MDDQIYTQPLYVPHVSIPGQGTHNVAYVTTVNDTVYAFGADDPRKLDPLWKRIAGFAQKLHAIDVTNGEERPGSPIAITASLPSQGHSNDGQGRVIFNPQTQNQRMALGLSNGSVYIGCASHGWLYIIARTSKTSRWQREGTHEGCSGKSHQ